MITVKHNSEGEYVVAMNNVERVVLNRLASAYAIPAKDMLAAVIIKGIDVIGKQVGTIIDRDKDHGDVG